MTKKNNLSIYTQLPGGLQAGSGIHETDLSVFGVDDTSGLMVAAQGNPGINDSSARVAVEILMDDMQTNLPQFASQLKGPEGSTLVKHCMQESIDNINEYLYLKKRDSRTSQPDAWTSISAIQYKQGHLSYIVTGEFSCLLSSGREIVVLKQSRQGEASILGENLAFETPVQSQAVSIGDILVIALQKDLDRIELDFMRLTLTRFQNNLDMAMRQINTRASRNGLDRLPGMIIGRVEQPSSGKSGWLGKLRKHPV